MILRTHNIAVDDETELPSVLADNPFFPVAATKYRYVASGIVDIRLIQDHFGNWKLRQPRLTSEPADCVDPAPTNTQLSLLIVVLWYDRLT